jgi:NADH-quinone oxidoreductase subunit M
MVAAMTPLPTPLLLAAVPMLGAVLCLVAWSLPRLVKHLAVAVALATVAAAVSLASLLTVPAESVLLVYLVSLTALVSILGQPVGREHRSVVLLTLFFLGLGLAALTGRGPAQFAALLVLLVLMIGLLHRQRSALRPAPWWGIGTFGLGAAAAVFATLSGAPLASMGALIACTVLLPLVPFHRGYVTALTRLPGNLPSFVVVLLPALGLHGLAAVMPVVPAAAVKTIVVLASISALYGAFKAVAQTQVRPLLAYGSLSLLSMVWWFAAATRTVTPSAAVFVGAVSAATSGLFIAWQVIRTRYGDDVAPSAISGLVSTMPRFAVLLSLIALAVMGVPPFGVYAGFIGMAFTSPIVSWVAFAAVLIAWLTSSWYILDAVQSLLFGRPRTDLRHQDLVHFELVALLAIVVIVLSLGIVPAGFFVSDSLIATDALRGWLTWHR